LPKLQPWSSLSSRSHEYRYMLFFGGVISTRVIKLYLWLMHGKTVIASKASDLEVLARAREQRPLLRRQMGLLRVHPHGCRIVCDLPVETKSLPHSLSALQDVRHHVSDQSGLGRPHYGWVAHVTGCGTCTSLLWGLRLRTIDVGLLHTAILTSLVGASRRSRRSTRSRPAGHQSTDLLLDPLHGRLLVVRSRLQSGGGPSKQAHCNNVLSEKLTSKLVSSKI